jgi:D-alanyl-D-alanine carboxypeptidase
MITLHNHNRLLGNYRIQVVGKTGWTLAAKKCFVGAATADGRELVVAVLGSRDLWGDLKRLIEFGFRGTDPPEPDSTEVEAASVPAIQSASGDDDADDVRSWRQIHSYAVRLATFRHLKGAAGLKISLSRNGYPARIEKIRRGHVSFYRVSVGSYPSRHAAEQAAGQLKETHRRLAGIVVVGS